ncbi:unnamed protein product [Cutaneotrichosporon oleaginosum]
MITTHPLSIIIHPPLLVVVVVVVVVVSSPSSSLPPSPTQSHAHIRLPTPSDAPYLPPPNPPTPSAPPLLASNHREHPRSQSHRQRTRRARVLAQSSRTPAG